MDVPIGFGEMAYANYNLEGPVAVAMYRVFDRPTHPNNQPLAFDLFLDPLGRENRRVLDCLATAPHIHLRGFATGADLPYLGSKWLAWRDELSWLSWSSSGALGPSGFHATHW